MNRRQLIAGLGAVASGAGAALGTGAFTSVTANRDVSVSLADEDAAYLAMEPGDTSTNGVFANTGTDDQITLDFNDEITTYTSSGTGVGLNSEYEFNDVFRISNQGTQTVSIKIPDVIFNPDSDGTDEVLVEFYVLDSGTIERIDGSNAEVELDTGNQAEIGVFIDITDGDDLSIPGEEKQFNGSTTVEADVDGFGASTVVTNP